MTLPYPIASIPAVWVDHQALQNLHTYCSKEGARVALIGFNEYAKHLVNMCGDNILGFYDPASWKKGIKFRGKPILGHQEKLGVTHIAICDILLAYDFADRISALYGDEISIYCPPRLAGKSTDWIDPFTQEQIYKDIFGQAAEAPLSMIGREKICFIIEMLRYALRLPGDVIEMGVWQGGSAWYIAKALAWHGEKRNFYLLDQFEALVNNRNATACNDEIERSLSFYPYIKMLVGLVHDPKVLSELAGRQYCFAHYDLGLHRITLEHLWDHLVPGAPLILDNYGLFAAWPGRFERFFAARGARVIRLPWSGQGLVVKHSA